MAQIFSNTALPWGDGSSIVSSVVRAVWGDGSQIYSNGGTYTAPSPPVGGTPAVPNLDPRTLIAAAAVYNLVPTLTVTDLRDGLPVVVDTVSFNTDEDAMFWALSMTGGQALYDKMKAGTQPPTVAVTLNGQEWRFVIEDVPRQRRHGDTAVRAVGRSLTCLAGAPYEFEQNWSLDGDTTALQLASAANANTGLQIEWGLVDWPIPDGVFSHTGTPLSVLKRVADAVGAMVQSDPKDFLVRVLPRYDLLPNEWPTVAPDVQIAEDALDAEGYENTNKPAYDGVYVLGQQGGAAAFVRLAGTSGANLKPMVTDPLLTDLAACQQRGMAELGASGEQQRHSLTLPVYSAAGQPGVMTVGRIVQVMEAAPWSGVVRSVAVQARHGAASQSVSVERHTRLIDGTTFDPNAPTPLRLLGTVPDQALTGGAYFSVNMAAYFTDGVPPYTMGMRSGTLPAWLQLDEITGDVFGTVPGSFTPFSVQFRCTDDINSTADTNAILFDLAVTSSSGLVAAKLGSTDYAKTATSPTASWVTGTGTTVGGAPRRLMAGPSVVMSILTSGGLARSTDGGNTWTTDSAFTPANAYTDPIWNGSTWTMFYFGSLPYKRYASSDGGATWTPTNFAGGYPASTGIAPTMIAMNGSTVLSARPSGSPTGELYVYKSTDGGVTWSAILADTFVDSAVRHILHITGTTWVLVNDDQIYRSTDDGGTWNFVAFASSVSVKGIATNGSSVVLVDGNAVDYSANAGASWSSASLPSSKQAEDVVFDGSVFVTLGSLGGTSNDICVSADGGATWGAHTGPGLGYNRLVNLI